MSCWGGRRHLHSFPTRRSSDLVRERAAGPFDGERWDSPSASRGISSGAAPRWSDGPHQSDGPAWNGPDWSDRSEEHTSELQSHVNLVCRLLLEKKKTSTIRDRR